VDARWNVLVLDAGSVSETAVVRQLTNGFHGGADDYARAFLGQRSNPGNP
jgi:hypothetical protein